MRKLTDRQARFVDEYLIDLSSKDAAIRAGFAKKQAKQAGYRLLQKEHVLEAIEIGKKALSERTGIKADEVIAELRLLAFSNPQDYTKDDGTVITNLRELTRNQAAAIQELVIDEYTDGKGKDARPVKRIRLKFADKRAAIVDLGRHLGLFTDNMNLSGSVSWEDALKDLK